MRVTPDKQTRVMDEIRDRAPSLALLCWLSVPIVAAIVFGFAASDGHPRPGAPLFTTLYSAGAIAAIIPLAARLKYAPEASAAILVILVVLGAFVGWIASQFVVVNPYEPQTVRDYEALRRASRDLLILPMIGVILALGRRDTFSRELDPATLREGVWSGLRRLLAARDNARVRAQGAAALLFGTLILLFLPLALGDGEGVGLAGMRWAGRTTMVATLVLLATSIRAPAE